MVSSKWQKRMKIVITFEGQGGGGGERGRSHYQLYYHIFCLYSSCSSVAKPARQFGHAMQN